MAHFPVPIERRRRHRAHVRWKVSLRRAASDSPLESTTENVSSGGFYCFLAEPLACGEKCRCWLEIPGQTAEKTATLLLECQTVVVHVETAAGRVGTGFRIEEFSVLRDGDTLPDFLRS